jgi:hypothetical protein
MGEEEQGADLNTLRGNSVTLFIRLQKGGHGASLF